MAAELDRKIRSTAGRRAMAVAAVLIGVGVGGCGAPPGGPVSEPTPALAGVHPCDAAALGATAAGAGGQFRGPGDVTFSCATLSVPLDHAGLRAGPQQPGRLSLQVAMADNTAAPRGVLIWLVGGPGEPGVELRVGRLTLDGASYGTFVAERYAITHPDRVSRLVLDSVVPHDTFDPLEIAAFNRTPQVLRMVCAETRCGTDPAQDLSQVSGLRHDGPELLNILSGLTGGAPRLTGMAAALHDAARGDGTSLDTIIAAETSAQATSAEQLSQGLHAATVCEDFVWPWGDADTPVPGRAGATAKAVAALPDTAVFRMASSGAGRQQPRRDVARSRR